MIKRIRGGMGGIWGLKCWRSNSGAFIPYIPSIVFLFNYFLAFHQLASIAFPSRARMSFIFRWAISVFLLSHAIDIWQKTILLVDLLVELYLTTEPHYLRISCLNLNIPFIYNDLTKFVILLILSTLPLLINWIVLRQQQSRFTWFDVRRRYRTELGSSRYYLSRPCSPLEQEKSRGRIKKTQSEEIRRPLRPLPIIKSKSA
ncbi:uncharacterized protein LOC106663787 isoform X1 [Cimex lectularius]|uniref:Uncharacterized protein n=1 Tax=Cimex lectularius TaxID=79782 RepID=A0A8I6RLM2_CIMLE|nr:uncharacterized protein LOC106663787 isoform X1 [Cimex lectularius]